MNDILKILDEKLSAWGLEFKGETCDSPLTWLGQYIIKGKKTRGNFGIEFIEWLNKELQFKFIEFTKYEDGDSGYTIISLKEQLFKIDLIFGSYEEVADVPSVSEWKAVKITQKTYSTYE